MQIRDRPHLALSLGETLENDNVPETPVALEGTGPWPSRRKCLLTRASCSHTTPNRTRSSCVLLPDCDRRQHSVESEKSSSRSRRCTRYPHRSTHDDRRRPLDPAGRSRWRRLLGDDLAPDHVVGRLRHHLSLQARPWSYAVDSRRSSWRRRRMVRLGARAGRLRHAVSRMTEHPQRVACQPTVVGTIAVAAATAPVAALVNELLEGAAQCLMDAGSDGAAAPRERSGERPVNHGHGQRPPDRRASHLCLGRTGLHHKPLNVSRLEHVIKVALAYRGREA
jgi:hypothetical protein